MDASASSDQRPEPTSLDASAEAHAAAASLLLAALKRDNDHLDEHAEVFLVATAELLAEGVQGQPRRARSIAYNLPRNEPLRRALLSGALTPRELCDMGTTDLAPDALKRAAEASARSAARLRAARVDEDELFSSTRSVRCPECQSNRARFKHLGTDLKDWHGRKNEVWGTKHEDDDGADCLIECLACGHSWHGTAPEVHEEDTADALEQARRKDLVLRPEPESVHKRA